MPALLCPSPGILDHSFPRNDDELTRAIVAFGKLQKLLEENKAHIIVTDLIREIGCSLSWENCKGRGEKLGLLTALINQWILTPHDRIVSIDVSDIATYVQHPIPVGSLSQGLVELWADDTGKLLARHDSNITTGGYCVGIACDAALSGRPIGFYDSPAPRNFPLVGENEIPILEDAYTFEYLQGIHEKSVSFSQALKNCPVIGGTPKKETDGSHWKVRFPGKRPWALDINNDPVPDEHLKELIPITGLDLPTIKTALITGEKPKPKLRIL